VDKLKAAKTKSLIKM